MNFNQVFFFKYKWPLIFGGGLISLLALMFVLLFLQPSEQKQEEVFLSTTESSVTSSQETSSSFSESLVYVDVKGAVKNPGMYSVNKEMRVWDVVVLAGGFTEEADTKQVNFSQKLVDQMIIYVPVNGEQLTNIPATESVLNSDSDVEGLDSELIDLNTASETELQTLTGIGLKKAQEIIRYREENGGFSSVDELKNISGIGEKTIEKLKDQITIAENK